MLAPPCAAAIFSLFEMFWMSLFLLETARLALLFFLMSAAVMAAFWTICAHSATTAFRLSPPSPWPSLLPVARYGARQFLFLVWYLLIRLFHLQFQVHGSLARAGKVRGQTPKVAKQTDKPKRVRGRAKRRLQYNRRFKNIVVGAGGKKKVSA